MIQLSVNKKGFSWRTPGGRYVFGMAKTLTGWKYSGNQLWAKGSFMGLPTKEAQQVEINVSDLNEYGNKWGLEDWHVPGIWCDEVYRRALEKAGI